MSAKIQRISNEIEKTKGKISDLQGKLRELEKQKTELENMEIVEAVRGMDISLADLAAMLKSNAATSGNGVPAKPSGFVGKGGATERVSFSPGGGNELSAVCDDAVQKSAAQKNNEQEDND